MDEEREREEQLLTLSALLAQQFVADDALRVFGQF